MPLEQGFLHRHPIDLDHLFNLFNALLYKPLSPCVFLSQELLILLYPQVSSHDTSLRNTTMNTNMIRVKSMSAHAQSPPWRSSYMCSVVGGSTATSEPRTASYLLAHDGEGG